MSVSESVLRPERVQGERSSGGRSQSIRSQFDKAAKIDNFAMPTANWYRRKADECVAPQAGPLNEERARR